jgi:hypothetical protein
MNDYADRMAASFERELVKIAEAKQAALAGAAKGAVPALLAGAAGWEMLRRANEDRRTGKMMRMQSNQGY